jgi:hypothetical protein
MKINELKLTLNRQKIKIGILVAYYNIEDKQMIKNKIAVRRYGKASKIAAEKHKVYTYNAAKKHSGFNGFK